MASWAINQQVAPDEYGTDAQSGVLDRLPVLDHVNVDVANQGIYWSLKQTDDLDPRQSGSWQPEVYMAPGSRTLSRAGMVGVRFRAAVPAAQLSPGVLQAVVTVEAVES